MKIALIVVRWTLTILLSMFTCGMFMSHENVGGIISIFITLVLWAPIMPASIRQYLSWLPVLPDYGSGVKNFFTIIRWIVGAFFSMGGTTFIVEKGSLGTLLMCLLGGLFLISPFGEMFFGDYRSPIRRYSVRPESRTGIVLSEVWWQLGIILFFCTAAIFSPKFSPKNQSDGADIQ